MKAQTRQRPFQKEKQKQKQYKHKRCLQILQKKFHLKPAKKMLEPSG